MAKPKEYDVCFKILLIGDQAVGKTAIMQRFCDDVFSPVYMSTLGLDFKHRIIEHCGKKVKLQIWDTAGQERFNTLVSAYYRGASGIILVYDITNTESFDHVSRWMENVQKYAKPEVEKVLLANKLDLTDRRLINKDNGQRLANYHNVPFLETSAKSNLNIDKAFFDLAQAILSKLPDAANSPSNDVIRPDRSSATAEKPKKGGCC